MINNKRADNEINNKWTGRASIRCKLQLVSLCLNKSATYIMLLIEGMNLETIGTIR